MSKPWFESPGCVNRRFCVDCRTKSAFKRALFGHGKVTAVDFACPYGITAESLGVAAKPTVKVSEHPWGARMWGELHRRPWLMELITINYAGELEWLAGDYAQRIPQGACNCRKHWLALLAETPPDLSSPDAYFRWTVIAHNRVNKRRKVKQWSLEEATARWRC